MSSYTLCPADPSGKTEAVKRNSDNAFIPFAADNIDYQHFKSDVLAGAELETADGNVMSQEEADAYIATLP